MNQYFLLTGNSYTDFGLPAMAAFIKAGYVIVATDYQGLGGGGKHQYRICIIGFVAMAPVIIYFGLKDVTLPPIMGKLYQDQMCKLGGNVTRVQLPGEQTHFSTPGSAEPLYVKWVADRFAGIAARNGC